MVSAIKSNTVAMGGKPLGIWDVADMLRMIYEANAPTEGLVLWLDAKTLFQLNGDAVQNGLTVIPAAREVNGIQLSELITPFGKVNLRLGECLPAGTALLLDFGVISPVIQPVPGKGNFFLEPLAKTGAADNERLSLTSILNIVGTQTLTVVNSSADSNTYTNSVLTVVKLA